MFSTKPVQRPSGPSRWFSKPDTPKSQRLQKPQTQKAQKTQQVPAVYPLLAALPSTPPTPGQPCLEAQKAMAPRVVGHRPAVATPPGRSTQLVASQPQSPQTPNFAPPRVSSRRRTPGQADDQKFDGWMAKFCVEPADDCNSCCLSFWVPCAQYGKTHWRLKQVESGQDPSDAAWKADYGCNGPCWAWCGLCCLFQCDCLLTGFQRTRIRATYGIGGSIANDLCLSIYCRPCTQVQMDREVRARHGEMDLCTNSKFEAPFVGDQPSRMPEMRYLSPRATSDHSQNGSPNIRRDCNGAGIFADGNVIKKLQNPPLNSANSRSAKSKWEESKSGRKNVQCSVKPSQSVPLHVEMGQLGGSALKAANPKACESDSYFSSYDVPPIEFNKDVQEGKRPKGGKSYSFPQSSANKNTKIAKSSTSSHDLIHCSPEPLISKAHIKQVAESKQEAEFYSVTNGKARKLPSRHNSAAENKSRDQATSEQTATDSESIVVRWPKSKASKRNAPGITPPHELSYVHDFTDCPVDKDILDYYEKEEKRSQASQASQNQQHVLEDCPDADISKQPKPDWPQTHNLADDSTERVKEAKPTGYQPQPHAFADCHEDNTTSKASPAHSQPNSLVNYAEKDSSKVKSIQPGPHALVDCEATDNNGDVVSSGPQMRALAQADRSHQSISNSPLEQHPLADCNGDGGRQARRASSSPESLTDRHSLVKEHRLDSCPLPVRSQRGEKAITAHHVIENARINESGDSQSTMKPSSHHTVSGYFDGADLEHRTAATHDQPRPERRGSLSSLLDLFKGRNDAVGQPQTPRYRKEVDDALNVSGAKRTSHAQQSLSQILAGSAVKRERSRDDTIKSMKGGIQPVYEPKQRSYSIGSAVREQNDRVEVGAKRSMENAGHKIKQATETAGAEAKE
ncbi:Cadmimum resistance [Hyphodiscus hymeniophilus]|uniref:Cadmimum resistance n=1 Tax=Hyphodiscus hymeniophilus TaxID=353542 RepID=A0A9P7AX72_9HELO|nr:Cadmimum resistance [Hyphodiscus hymeniophilus]